MKTTAIGAPDFLVVDEHVARNPIARAIARRRFQQAMLDFQIRLLELDDGEHVPLDCQAAAKTLAVAMAVLELQGRADTPDARVIAGGMGSLTDMATTGWLWRTRHATAVDQALQRAETAYREAPARIVQLAHQRVHDIERRAARQAASA